MKKVSIHTLTTLMLVACVVSSAHGADRPGVARAPVQPGLSGAVDTKNRKEAISYAIGVTTARNLVKDGVEFNPETVIRGMQDALSGQRLQMNEHEIRMVMSGLVGEMRQKMAANRKEAEEINKKRGEEYRASYAKQEGVVTLPNGVMYKAQRTGSGPKPSDESEVLVNYRGTLTSGKEFDATQDGKPAKLQVGRLIVGWREALKLMPAGSRWTVVIPPQLGYGQRGVGADIGPNETLVFDIDLVEVLK